MLKLTVLADNHTYIDQYYLGEPAVSYYLELEGYRVLFDTGYSDVYLKNAAALGIDLQYLDAVVVSHGHNDHTGGLKYFQALGCKPKLVGHPEIFTAKRAHGLAIGCPVLKETLAEQFTLALSRTPVELTSGLWFLGEIERSNTFENKRPVGEKLLNGTWQPDFVRDDSALAYKTEAGLVIITGCSHAGICNICEYAKKVTGVEKLRAVIGGFHLPKTAPSEQLAGTLAYLQKQPGLELYPCHCTCFMARAEMYKSLQVHEVGVSMQVAW